MSFAICRMQKMKSHDLKGMQFHNQRERESKTNPDIDKSKSHLNYDLVHPQKIDYNTRVKEIIESQKTGTRKTRKDAVLVNELLITSDKSFFDHLDQDEQKRFFEESYKLFSERYGEQNIAYSTVHMDENTPHMHLGVVPMRDGKLQGKNVFNRAELQWIQDEFPKHMQGQGFDLQRGEKGSDREHLTSQRFKAQAIKEEVETLENHLTDLGRSLDKVKKIDDVEVKQEKKMGLFASDRLILERKDFDSIKTLAKASEGLRNENQTFKREIQTLQEENYQLKEENKQLRKERDWFKGHYERLEKLMKRMQAFYKEKIPEAYERFEQVKGYCKLQVNKGLSAFSIWKFKESDMSDQEKVGFAAAKIEGKKAKKKWLSSELER